MDKNRYLKKWFMTTQRTNKSFDADIQEGGKYRIIDSRNGKQNIIEGTYEELVLDEYIKMTIGMPGLSEEEDVIEVEFFEERMAELKCSFTIALLLKRKDV